jgi:hypothetical protein
MLIMKTSELMFTFILKTLWRQVTWFSSEKKTCRVGGDGFVGFGQETGY